MNTIHMSAGELALSIRKGTLKAAHVARDFLDAVEKNESAIQAWAFIDPDYVLQQAEMADHQLSQGAHPGPLHGIPVGIKDIIDTSDMPTENGTALHLGRQPLNDAFIVSLLRGAGAVIMGKTVTAELAFYTPGKTTNPYDHSRTPGGSSSGSAAAVSSKMVPLALGTQTNGSVIRPASYCGVTGFKPTHGRISRTGVLHQSWHLDQVGVFANSIEDAALLSDVLMVYDGNDPSMRPCSSPNLHDFVKKNLPVTRIGFVKSPVWNKAEEETKNFCLSLNKIIGLPIEPVDLPPAFDQAIEAHKTIMEADFALSFHKLYEQNAKGLSPVLRETIERGHEVKAIDYNRCVETVPFLIQALNKIFEDYDLLVTPATCGSAPIGLNSTGSPVFNTIWTLCGVPAVSLPVANGPSGMPLGLQLIGKRGEDGKLLANAQIISEFFQ